MSHQLIDFYERELDYLRKAGAEFAKNHPKVAGQLDLQRSGATEDPHVERLLEGFAFLAARVHLKLDDDFPELCEALLNVVYPGYVRPIPSMAIVQLELDPLQGKHTDGRRVSAGTPLLTEPIKRATKPEASDAEKARDGEKSRDTEKARAVDRKPERAEVRCKFRTCYDTVLWPLTIGDAQWTTPDRLRPAVRADKGVSGAIRIAVKTLPDVSLSSLKLNALRLHLTGLPSLVSVLYEVMANNTTRVLLRDLSPDSRRPPIELPASALTAVGFAEDEGMLPSAGRAFHGYRLLTEYFAFPERFFFFDVNGLGAMRDHGFGDAFEIVLLTSPFELAERRQALETGVNAETFRLGCTPVVNLFEQASEPILLTQKRHEHVVVADHRRRHEIDIFSVDSVKVQTHNVDSALPFEPLYSLRHHTARADRGRYYVSRRRETPWQSDQSRSERSSEVLISFVDRAGQLSRPASDTVTCQLTCYNANLPSRFDVGQSGGDFSVQGGGPYKPIQALGKPTAVVQPYYGRELLSRLISHLSLNYLSLTDDRGDALRELLRLHDFTGTEANERQVKGIVGIASRNTYARMVKAFGMGMARGRAVDMELNESDFTGLPMFLFASVIEHFLGMYASINSFSQLRMRSTLRRNPVREWAPRGGWKPIL